VARKEKTFNHIARVVRVHREALGISQYHLSQDLGFKNGQFVSNVERGLCSILIRKVGLLVELLSIPYLDVEEAMIKDHRECIQKNTFGRVLGSDEALLEGQPQ